MKWSRRTALVAGLTLITASNMVALGGAAYNRDGEPESTLILTQRELRPPFAWVDSKENSGLALQLRWRVVPSSSPTGRSYLYNSEGGGAPAWLDAPKLASLGFDTKVSTGSPHARGNSTDQRQLPRDVLVVLELDGPAYQEALERATQAAKDVEAKNERGNGRKEAQDIMDRESRLNSRLFAVDVGLDRDSLRRKFPDRTKYAIVRGQVRPTWSQGGEAGGGFIDSLSAASVNVPLHMRGALEGVTPVNFGQHAEEGKHFEAGLAFGRRLEPWLVSIGKK
jgi:hypothetical protein